MKNRINPSKIPSYNCDGCLYKSSTRINLTAQGTLVSTPFNSELIKFAILPKNIPRGATKDTISK